jgi:hypothetical protein
MARTVEDIEADLRTVSIQMKALKAERTKVMKTDPALQWLPRALHTAYKKKDGSERIDFLQQARIFEGAAVLDLVRYWDGAWMLRYQPNYVLQIGDCIGPVWATCWKSKEGFGSGYSFGSYEAESLEALLKQPEIAAIVAEARQYRD